MRNPLLHLALAYAAGDLAGERLAAGPRADAALALAAAALLLLLGERRRRRLGSVLPCVLAAVGLVGFAAARGTARGGDLRPATLGGDAPVLVRGVLAGDPRPVPRGVEVRLRLEEVGRGRARRAALGGAQILLPPGTASCGLRAGDRLRVWAVLHRPRSYRDRGTFDYAAYLRRKGVLLTGRCKSLSLMERIGRGRPAAAATWLAALRREARRGLRAALPHDDRTRGLLEALLLGERAEVDPELAEELRRAGAAHVLTVSGLHVGLLAMLLHSAARRLRVGPGSAAALTAAGAVGYALVAGAGAPVLRAALLVVGVAASRILYRRSRLPNALGAAALLILCADPPALGDVSFRLTFAATAGMALLTGRLEAGLERSAPRLPDRLRRLLAASLAAQAAILPETTARFGLVAGGGFLSNLVAVPAAALLVAAAPVIAALGRMLPVAARPLGWSAAGVVWVLGASCRALGGLAWEAPPPPVWLVAAYYLLLALIVSARGGAAGRWARLGLAAAIALLACHPFGPERPPSGTLRVTALDVGQGDAILIEEEGRAILVDTGGALGDSRFDIGRRVVVPALRSRGLRRLDALVLTHPDRDHVGGAAAVLRSLEIGAIWRAFGDWSGTGWEDAAREAARRGVPVRYLEEGDLLKAGRLWVEVLWPPRPPPLKDNDASLVLRVRMGRRGPGVLLTGDLEAGGERELVRNGIERTTVLKAGHHGSGTSSTPAFIRAVHARAVLVSVGLHNPWGHPQPEVIERFRRSHAVVLRTDRLGAVAVDVDGEGRVRVPPSR